MATVTEQNEWVGGKQAAALLPGEGITPKAVAELARRGLVGRVKIPGKAPQYRRDDLLSVASQNACQNAPPISCEYSPGSRSVRTGRVVGCAPADGD